MTLQDVRLELSKEEALQGPSSNFQTQKMSMTGFLTTGLELEDRQYVNKFHASIAFLTNKYCRYQLRHEISEKKKLKTSKQHADIQEKRNALHRQITNWRLAQLVYTPHSATALGVTDESCIDLAENAKLWLPSSLPNAVRSLSEMKRICNAERRLRYAQCLDSLAQIRRQRRIIQGLWQFKKINISGTGNRPNTRMLATYHKINRKLARAAHTYRTARAALSLLDPDGDWHVELKELQQEDIRGPGKEADESNGRFVMSWIWLTRKPDNSSIGTEAEFNECMRVEWTKARARMMRWQEEYLILQEEMRRVITWFEWKGTWWQNQATRRTNVEAEILRGISAYAYKQADLVLRMARRCAEEWMPVLASKNIHPDWEINYPSWKDLKRKKKATEDECEGDFDENEEMVEDEGLDMEEACSDSDDEGDEDIIFEYDD